MFNIGPGEMMLLALLALLLFGPKRLPEIGKAAGEAIASFRNASRELTGEMQRQLAEENKPEPAAGNPAEDASPEPGGLDAEPPVVAPEVLEVPEIPVAEPAQSA